jgi:hypothetical protein
MASAMGLPNLLCFFLMSGCSNPVEEKNQPDWYDLREYQPKSKLIFICEHFHTTKTIYMTDCIHKCITMQKPSYKSYEEYNRHESMKMSLPMLHPQLNSL